MEWWTLLDGGLAEQARKSVSEIALALRVETPGIYGPSYGSGEAGIALFYACLASTSGQDEHAEQAEIHLTRSIDWLMEASFPPGLFDGLAGIAWATQQVEILLRGSASPKLTEDVDDLLVEAARTSPWPSHYDLIYGLVGLGCYALHHVDPDRSALLLGLVVERLEELAENGKPGFRWHTPPHLIKRDVDRRTHPGGFYNLGTAHGIGGVIGLLAAACGRPRTSPRAQTLLDGAVTWLLANKRLDDGGSVFGGFAQSQPASCRSAWCYGDPGLAWMLLWAARSAQREEWEAEALAIARRDARRPYEETGVSDSGVCHGAAGLGHMYNRLYHSTGDAELAEAARGWFRRALDLRKPGIAPAGYACWLPEVKEWRGDASLLCGATGVGLALLSATSPVEPVWDRPLLISTPPPRS